MHFYRRFTLCSILLAVLAASLARAGDGMPQAADDAIADELVADQAAADQDFGDREIELLPEASTGCSAALASPGTPLSVFIPCLRPGWEFSGGFLWLKPGADNLGWSTVTTFLPLPNPQWAVQTLTPAYQPGYTFGARYVFPANGKDIRVNWEHLHTRDSSYVPVPNTATQWISPFNQTGPSTSEDPNQVGIFHFKSAAGQVAFGYDMVNLEVGQTVNLGRSTQVRLLTGLSWALLQEQLITTFYNDPNIDPQPPVIAPGNQALSSISLNNTSSFSGLGPRLGLTTLHNLTHGFSFVGGISGAILGGWMRPAEYSFSAVLTNNVNSESIRSRTVTQIVYETDAKLGLNWLRQLRGGSLLTLESGFKAAVFINPFSTYETSTNVLPLDIGSLSTNSMRHTPSNFTLNGWYANCSLQW